MNKQNVRWSTSRRGKTSAAKASVRARLQELLLDPRLAPFGFATPAVLGREHFEAFSPVAKLAIEILPGGTAKPGSVDRTHLLEQEGIVVLGLGDSEILAHPSSLVDFLLALIAALTEPAPPPPPDAC